jgi:hypothetical protein
MAARWNAPRISRGLLMKNPAVLSCRVAVALGLLGAGLGAAPAPATATTPAGAPPPALSDAEKQEGFKLLFDGTTRGWRQLGGKDFPQGWDVRDGALHHIPGGGGGDITVDETFDNFELRFEFKIAADGNSGLKYRVVEQPDNHAALGIEYQVVDARSATADNKNKHALASLYDLVEAKITNPPAAATWNKARIIVSGNHFEHWLEDKKVAELDYGTDAWKTAFAASKWAASNPTFASVAKAHIILQDHTDEVWFRNLRIKMLKAE